MCSAFFLAYLLRLDFRLNEYNLDNALNQIPFVVFVQFSALYLVGAYSILWRYVSLEDIKVFLKAAAVSAVVLLLVRLLLSPERFIRWQVPLSVIVMDTGLAFAGLLGLRVLRRFAYELREKRRFDFTKKPRKRKATLFVGAGRIGAAAVKEVVGRRDTEFDVKGFIDDDRQKKGGSVGGIRVLGTTSDLARLVDELNVDHVVIAMDNVKGKEIRRVLDICRTIPVKAQIVPSLNEIIHGRINVSRIRDVQIEDLLRRDPVELDTDNLHEFLSDKTILVTGAGGSIGSELVRQVANFDPKKILLVERAEFALFQIERELANGYDINFEPLVADISDAPRMREIFANHRPDIILHAAAHKHVPLMEKNSCEAIKNNIFATQFIAELAGEFGADAFVLISTDKAVNPSSIMGASKRMAEIVSQNLSKKFSTRYMAVRFGNVLGSAGSVVPIFQEQIKRGEAVTVTDPKMTRYFMTIPEASQLVLQAGAIGGGGEIFILDMGEPVKILELAEDVIRLSGLKPYEDVDIVFTGVRPGEKLFEELEISGENLLKTRHPKIYIGKIATYTSAQVDEMNSHLRSAVEEQSDETIRGVFNRFLPEARIDSNEKMNISTLNDSARTKSASAIQSTQS